LLCLFHRLRRDFHPSAVKHARAYKKRAGVEIELRPFLLLLLARFVATSSLSFA
jgi:hypothetical protein